MSTTLQHLATNRFVQTRLTTLSGFKKTFATTTGVKANLQPLSPEKTNLYNGVMGKTYAMYLDGTFEVLEGDRFREVSTNKKYQVQNGGVSRRTHGIVDINQVIVSEVN